jgi:Fur family transcriptional regulator, ferric uptake regulator
MPPDLLSALAASDERLTSSRRRVAQLIAAREGHFTAADLLADASRARAAVGRATVFRTLELLTGLGLLERLDLPSGEHAYVACAPRHHHHVVCSSCGRATFVPDLGLAAVMREAGDATGYRIDEHRLELYGTCPQCQQRAPH